MRRSIHVVAVLSDPRYPIDQPLASELAVMAIADKSKKSARVEVAD
jgi:hypothetical protein